jgi:diaminopimelate decarboxylase
VAPDTTFHYRDGELYCEDVPVRDVSERFGTPCYVYSRAMLLGRFARIRDAFEAWNPLVCFSVKSCGNLAIIKDLAEAGSGFDVVSGGELYRAVTAGAEASRIVFAGAGKTREEIAYALDQGILMFDVESRPELEAIASVAAEKGTEASIALRVNPDVDPRTHAKTTTGKAGTKFGMGMAEIQRLAPEAASWAGIRLCGLHFHLGSPIYTTEPYERALEKALPLLDLLRDAGCPIDTLNLGGGYCISYTGEDVAQPGDYAAAVKPYLEKSGCPVIIIEPGRYIAGNSALLVTQVVYRKETELGKRFLICDAAMNDLIRPTLYEAFHRVWPVRSANGMPDVVSADAGQLDGFDTETVDVVGPVCETGDYVARERALPRTEAGDLLAVFDAGAYGFTMSSNYNARRRAAEVLVDGSDCRLIRRRETYGDLVAQELELLD